MLSIFAVVGERRGMYLVIDTEDEVLEQYTANQLFHISETILIHGVDRKNMQIHCVSPYDICRLYIARSKLSGDNIFHFDIREDGVLLSDVDIPNKPIPDIILPYGLSAIDVNAFKKWERYHEVSWAYEKKEKDGYVLNSIKVPSTVTGILPYTFSRTDFVKEVIVSEGLGCISREAFRASGIVRFIAPSTLCLVQYAAFANCPNLSYLSFENTKMTLGNFGHSSLEGARKVYFPRSCFEDSDGELIYRRTLNWSLNTIFGLQDYFEGLHDLSAVVKKTKRGYLLKMPKEE